MGRFEDALRTPGLGAIAEIKRRSPSAGDLRPDADPARIAPAYASAGAAAISVLVDERFGGTWDDLRAASAATNAPLLAKGFFSTPEHLRTAKEAGADAVLLLLRDLDDETVRRLLGEAEDLALDTLVEAHDADELRRALALDAPVVGVNARDLSTFAIDRRAQLELVASVPADRVVIAENTGVNASPKSFITVERSSFPAWRWLWKHRARVWRKRQEIQRRRRVSDRELLHWFV